MHHLPISHQYWSHIALDFVTGLPLSSGKTNCRLPGICQFSSAYHPQTKSRFNLLEYSLARNQVRALLPSQFRYRYVPILVFNFISLSQLPSWGRGSVLRLYRLILTSAASCGELHMPLRVERFFKKAYGINNVPQLPITSLEKCGCLFRTQFLKLAGRWFTTTPTRTMTSVKTGHFR